MVGGRLEYNQAGIISTLEHGRSIMVRGGAGSGKTYALEQTVEGLVAENPHINIACITYTNAAADEITSRGSSNKVVACTIHSFLWGFISQFQNELSDCFKTALKSQDEQTSIKR